MKQGVNLAVEEINKAGGVKGRQLVALFEDDASVPAQSVSATEKLINKDEVAFLIGTFNSATTLADMKIIERDKTPMMVPIAVAIEITESGNKWVFRNSATNPMQAEQLMNYIYKETGLRKFAVLHENTDYGKGLMVAVQNYIKKNGGSMIAESYSIGDTDFYAQLTKIKNNAPEGLIICGNLSEGSQITRQFKELGLKGQLFGFGGLSSYDFNNVAAGSNEGPDRHQLFRKRFSPTRWPKTSSKPIKRNSMLIRICLRQPSMNLFISPKTPWKNKPIQKTLPVSALHCGISWPKRKIWPECRDRPLSIPKGRLINRL